MGFPKNYGRNPHKHPVSSVKKTQDRKYSRKSSLFLHKNHVPEPSFPQNSLIIPHHHKKITDELSFHSQFRP